MKKIFFKIFWYVFPLTKLVYAYVAYSSGEIVNNTFEIISLLLLFIGTIDCLLSIYLSKKIFKKGFFENKIFSILFGNHSSNNEPNSLIVQFNLFTVVLGLAETAALFGLVQYLITGNLIVISILFGLCIIAWLFNYPNSQEIQES